MPGCGGLRRGVVPAGLRHGGAPQGSGEVEAAANGAAHRAAEAADEARTNPLAGLGGKAGGGERDWHWGRSIVCAMSFCKRNLIDA